MQERRKIEEQNAKEMQELIEKQETKVLAFAYL